MARATGRYRKIWLAGLTEGERINSVSLEAEAWLWRLHGIADDYGNLPYDVDVIRGKAAPKRRLGPATIRRLTDSLVEAGLLTLYEADGDQYLHCEEYEVYQNSPNGKPTQRYPLINDGGVIQSNPDESRESCSPRTTYHVPRTTGQGTADASGRTPPRFTPPTVDEVKAYCESEGLGIDPGVFVDHYASKGWKVGKSPMKDWRAAARGWHRRDAATPKPGTKPKRDYEALAKGDGW